MSVNSVQQIATMDLAAIIPTLEKAACSSETRFSVGQTPLPVIRGNSVNTEQTTTTQMASPQQVLPKVKSQVMSIVEKKHGLTLAQKKSALIETMRPIVTTMSNLSPTISNASSDMLVKVASANSPEVLKAVTKEMLVVTKDSYTNAFTTAATTAVVRASRDVSFADIKIFKPEVNLIRVVATDASDRMLVSEIAINADNGVSVTSELAGFHDGSCKKVMEDFNNALERHGLKPKERKSKGTQGVPQMSYLKNRLKRKRRVFSDEKLTQQKKKEIIYSHQK